MGIMIMVQKESGGHSYLAPIALRAIHRQKPPTCQSLALTGGWIMALYRCPHPHPWNLRMPHVVKRTLQMG